MLVAQKIWRCSSSLEVGIGLDLDTAIRKYTPVHRLAHCPLRIGIVAMSPHACVANVELLDPINELISHSHIRVKRIRHTVASSS